MAKNLWTKAVRSKIRPLMLELVVYSLFINSLALVIPLFVLQVYNRVVAFGNIATLQGLVIGVALALAFDFLLRQIRSRVLQKAAMRIDVGLGQILVKKFWALPLKVLENRPSSYWHGVFRDADVVRNTVAGPPFLLLIDLPFAILFIGLIFIIAKPIAWIFVSIIPVFVLLATVSGRMVGKASDAEKESQRKRDSLIGDMINNRGTVKAIALDRGVQPYWEDAQTSSIESSLGRGTRNDGFVNLGTILTLATTATITSFGALAIIDQELSIGALIAANMLSNRVIGPFSQLIGTWKGFAAYKQSKSRLKEVLSLPTERESVSIDLERPNGNLKLENVRFGYVEDTDPVLENLNAEFSFKAVHMVMGPNGGGKSTLIKLLKGLYIPDDGRILLDGADVTQFTRGQLSRWIGYVPQETLLIDGSIKENITSMRDDIDDEEVINVCQQLGIHEAITSYPDGYATHVGEAGRAMSGGLRQRIAIARALIGDPPILVLDEPSASLDRHAENRLMELLHRLGQQRTVIVVSHSPILLGAATNLYLLDKKRIIMAGPRDEVLKKLENQAQKTGNGEASKGKPLEAGA